MADYQFESTIKTLTNKINSSAYEIVNDTKNGNFDAATTKLKDIENSVSEIRKKIADKKKSEKDEKQKSAVDPGKVSRAISDLESLKKKADSLNREESTYGIEADVKRIVESLNLEESKEVAKKMGSTTSTITKKEALDKITRKVTEGHKALTRLAY